MQYEVVLEAHQFGYVPFSSTLVLVFSFLSFSFSLQITARGLKVDLIGGIDESGYEVYERRSATARFFLLDIDLGSTLIKEAYRS